MRFWILPLLLLLAGDAPPRTGWEIVLEWCDEEAGRLAEDLDRAHALLTARAKEEAPALLEKLSPKPPGRRSHGYGLVPELRPDREIEPVRRHRTRYSLESLTTSFTKDIRDGAVLSRRAAGDGRAPLAMQVDEFVRLRSRLALFESHISYHRYWQKAVPEYPDFFARLNGLLAKAEELDRLLRANGDAAKIRALRTELAGKLAPFRRAKGLAIVSRGEELILPVEMSTDIDDDAFLGAFAGAVRAAFAESEAARKAGFRVELTLSRIAPENLYPEGPPARGAEIDEKGHIARFPEGAIVLTTGARSTHAFAGRYIQLGSDPTRPRVLAHEFGHLLGFTDGYLRGFTGDPAGPYGCVLVEWSGLLDDLMGSPAQGAVTDAMIRRLIEAYGPGR